MARPSSIARIDDEMKELLREIAERDGITELDASKVLARRIKESKRTNKIDWGIV